MTLRHPFGRLHAPLPTSPKPATDPLPTDRCDCLNHCGDDPRLKRGAVPHCEHHQRLQRERAEASELASLERAIATDSAASTVECECHHLQIDGGAWLDTSRLAADVAPAVAQACRYLELRGQLQRHGSQPALVRLAPALTTKPT